MRCRQQAPAERHAGRGPEDQRGARFGAADEPAQHVRQRIADGGHQNRHGARREKSPLLGPQRDHHADEAQPDGDPVPRLHRFAQHRHGDEHHQQRRDERERVGLGQAQGLQAVDEEHQHRHVQRGAQQVQAPAQPTVENTGCLAPPGDVQAHQGQRRETAQRHHLHRRVVPGQGLEQRVHAGEEGAGQQHRGDAAQGSGRVHGQAVVSRRWPGRTGFVLERRA
ncbi:hypothetical protein D9M72_487280 [compost metagenome]